jgi:nitrogenase molybdenum-iron protein beta chain
MAKLTDQAIYKCGLGAVQSAQAIEGVLPVLHAGPGCAGKVGNASGHFSAGIFPSTNISETEIVFGGEQKLYKTIENALKIIDAELYAVFTSCASEIIGDDSEEIVERFRREGKPVIHVSAAGFKGNNYEAHEWLLEALFNQYLPAEGPRLIENDLVNVWSGLPIHDPFWSGNYNALERLLQDIGLRANIIFGYGRGLKKLDKVPSAAFNLVVGPWLGLESAQLLEKKYGTPYLHYPSLPIGPSETGRFLLAVTEFAGLDTAKTKKYISEKEKEYYYHIERFATTFFETRVMSKRFTVVSDTQYALAITRFLVNDFGLGAQKQFAMENAPEHHRERIKAYFRELDYGDGAEVEFETDGFTVHEEIKKLDYLGNPLILGSYWEKKLKAEIKAHYLGVSWPLQERMVINGAYVGYDGGLKLIEDIYSTVLQRFL